MKLFVNLMSTNSKRAAIAAYQLKLPIEFQTIDFQSDFLESPEFRKINPNGMIPALQDGEFTLWESCAIQNYLCDKFPAGKALYPADPAVRADINRWQFWAMAHMGQQAGTLQWENFLKPMFGMGDADPKLVNEALEMFHEHAKVLESHLSKQPYLVANQLTLADFAVAVDFAYWQQGKMPLNEYPKVVAWFKKIEATEGWKQTNPA